MTAEICKLCKKTAQYKCSACLLAFYCSKEHQKLDWAVHKRSCSAFEIVKAEGMGRCLMAKRNIRAGEVLLREAPLVTGPPQITGPVCLGCHNAVSSSETECPKCGWPLCSLDCASSPNHRPECDWAVTVRKEKVRISNFVTPHPTYACILPLRLLYSRYKEPNVWAKLSSLESHSDMRKKDGKWSQELFAVADLLKRFYRLGPDVTNEDILQISGIIQINGHEVPLSLPACISVYWKCSLLEHSCFPNCSKSFNDKGEVIIRAAVPISAGQRLSICYTDPLWGTPSRLHHLENTKYFLCKCMRCSDPTELGTYFSAISCEDSCHGRLLPESFSDPKLKWKCSVCQLTLEPEAVSERLTAATEALVSVDKTSPLSLWSFLSREDLGLSENHYHRVEASVCLAQLIGQTSGGLRNISHEWLHRKEQLIRRLLQLSSVLFPAECRLRGMLCFELHAAIAERSRRSRNNNSNIEEELLESRKNLEEAIQHLKYEAKVLPEGKVCRQAKENLKDLDALLLKMNISIPGLL